MTEVTPPVLHSPPFGQKVSWSISELPPGGKSIGKFWAPVHVCCCIAGDGGGFCVLVYGPITPAQEARQYLITESERLREREGKEIEREEETQERVIERRFRPVEIHHDVRHADILRPHIHHCSRIRRHKRGTGNWWCGVEWGQVERDRRGEERQIGWYVCPKSGQQHPLKQSYFKNAARFKRNSTNASFIFRNAESLLVCFHTHFS